MLGRSKPDRATKEPMLTTPDSFACQMAALSKLPVKRR
jgi:hypothetical protein